MELGIRASIELVLCTIIKTQPVSRATIAKITGLSKPAVSEAVEKLINYHLICELGISEISRGRPPMMLSINADTGVIVGIEADKISSKIGVSNLNGDLLSWSILPRIEDDPTVFLSKISQELNHIQEQYRSTALGVVGIGFGILGSYDEKAGVIEYSANQASWAKYPLRLNLERLKPGIPVRVERNAQMGAMAEIAFGDVSNVGHLVYLSSSWGLGVGVLSEGSGGKYNLGRYTRFGHTTIQWNGQRCICGNRGCLEEYASVRTLFHSFYPDQEPSMGLFEELVKRYQNREPEVTAAVRKLHGYLSIGAANAINAYNPTHFCFGGLLPQLIDDDDLDRIQEQVDSMLIPAHRQIIRLNKSQLGELGVLYGCFASVRENLAGNVMTGLDHAAAQHQSEP